LTEKVCWQYEVKVKKQLENKGISPVANYSEYSIDHVPYSRAKEFILEYEWIGNMGTSKICYGITFGSHLAAVVCYGALVAPQKYTKVFGSELKGRILQLCRGATTYWAPKWAASKLIASSMKLLSDEQGIRVVVAYADPEAGEVGTIYQACNAIYLGSTVRGGGKKYVVNGHCYDPRKAFKKFGSVSKENLLHIDPNYKAIPIPPKHRYMFVLGSKSEKKKLHDKVKGFEKPYPNRNQENLGLPIKLTKPTE
jgi:hypothetical protein